jgi:dinuclear metal center YbgI/SA1388 family protein
MHRDDVARLLDGWLEPGRFTDVAENGMQVEGRPEIDRVLCGVSASRALIDAAIAARADAIFVHHGLVWSGGIRKVHGWLKDRLSLLLTHGISLFAYHLPLDAHPTLGNNAGLADALGLAPTRAPFGRYKGQTIGLRGELPSVTTLDGVVATATKSVGAPIAAFGRHDRPIRTVALCTGGAPDLFTEAIDAKVDLYVTGEATEWVKSCADESGTAFLALGHHATERFGAQRVCAALVAAGLPSQFVDVENPV